MEHFLKVDGVIAAQTPKIEPAFRTILGKFSTIIEIGFHRGALSLWLYKNKNDKTKLVCYDITLEFKEVNNDNIDFRQGDCFDENIINEIKMLIESQGKTLVLCDGGYKEKEFNLFSTFLKIGDVIMLHDYAHSDEDYERIKVQTGWKTHAESKFENIQSAITSNNLQSYYYDKFKEVLWGSFIKK
jgi:23S rRNA U2552 (ribose-2'-O)-methylase RlmE/FtsJ